MDTPQKIQVISWQNVGILRFHLSVSSTDVYTLADAAASEATKTVNSAAESVSGIGCNTDRRQPSPEPP